ncbi:hypothetical protein C8F01DRAFT_1380165 [Mycena amicta]|nr:hypothetical protein C8F01DRAFT_1380165 [Mycena amicta]
MPPEHSSADKQYIGRLTVDELMEFREWAYSPRFIEANHDLSSVTSTTCVAGPSGSEDRVENSSAPIQPSVPVLPVTPECFDACSTLSTGGDEELHAAIGGESIDYLQFLSISDRVWLDEHIMSRTSISCLGSSTMAYDSVRLRSQPPGERIELAEIPSIWPNPKTRTAFIVSACDDKSL